MGASLKEHMRVWVRSAGLVALASCGALSKPAFGQQMGDAPTITPTRFNGKPTTGWPGPRGGHTLTALSGGRFLMVGGTEGRDGTALNSIFELDTTKMHWRALPDSSTKSLPASIGHQAVQADSGVVCFGGTTGKQELSSPLGLRNLRRASVAPWLLEDTSKSGMSYGCMAAASHLKQVGFNSLVESELCHVMTCFALRSQSN